MGAIPDIENMVKLGRYFDCSIDYLMKTESDADNDQGINKHNTDVKKSSGSIIQRCISIASIMIGGILVLLMPLFAKWYQASEFRNFHEYFTNSSEYILLFPLVCILIIAVLLLSVGIVLLYRNGKPSMLQNIYAALQGGIFDIRDFFLQTSESTANHGNSSSGNPEDFLLQSSSNSRD